MVRPKVSPTWYRDEPPRSTDGANHIAHGGPDFDFLTYPLDLSGIREVYIHSSISDNWTLSISGMRSCICVVQVDESWGSAITYRPFSLADSDVIRLQDGTLGPTIRFWLTDYLGRPQPHSSPPFLG